MKEKLKIIVITTGFSNFISNLYDAGIVDIKGVLDCGNNDELNRYTSNRKISHKTRFQQTQESQEWIKEKKTDLIITYKVPFLLKKEIFSLPQYGSINIHPSLLPQYRGINPWFWIYFNMERKSGVTIHKIDEKEDHGEIIAQSSFEIQWGDELEKLRLIVENESIILLKRIISEIKNIKGYLQNEDILVSRASSVLDYASVINIKNIEVVRLWHLLRGFPWLLPILYPDFKYKGEYIINPPTTLSVNNEYVGKIKEDNRSIYLFCKNGMIDIKKLEK